MSLLDKGTELVWVYPEEVTEDSDGNVFTQPSACGIRARARLSYQGQSGTSSRRAEQQEEGFESEKVYELRFTRKDDAALGELGAQSQIGWGVDSQGREVRWSIFGDVQRHNSSPATRRNIYTIRRS